MNHPDIPKYQSDPEADWGILPNPNMTVARITYANQAEKLPDSSKIHALPTLGPGISGFKLSCRSEFDQWLANVNNILTAYGLSRLIDVQIPRPKCNSPDAEHWLNMSMQVSRWLTSNMLPHMYQWVVSHGYRVILPNELIYLTGLACRNFNTSDDIGVTNASIQFNHAT
jgi:hypothetical protein